MRELFLYFKAKQTGRVKIVEQTAERYTASKPDEYEIIKYPKLNHVQCNMVNIIYRNSHVHRELELGLVLDGEGEALVHRKSFALRKGSLFFYNSNEPHEIVASSQAGVKIAYLQIANNFCQEYLHLFRDLELSENDLSSFLTPARSRELTGLLLQTIEDYRTQDVLHCMSSICLLYGRLLAYVPHSQLDESICLARNKKMARLRRITEYVDSNYADKLSLTQLAASENVTPTYLSHFIRDNLHMTFQEYVSGVRFEKALKLMNQGNMRLTDISIASGFSDLKYLNRMFERRFGYSPKEYYSHLQQPMDPELPLGSSQIFVSEELQTVWLDRFRCWLEKRRADSK